MKAAILNGYNKNGCEIAVMDIPVPEITPDEVLVKIRTAGVNPLDNMIIKGEVKLIVPYKFPLVMGNEFCGIIEKTGANVKGFEVGDRVYARMPLILGKDSLRDWVRPDGDPSRIAKKALTNMVMEKAVDYPEPKPGFMQI